jgi:hypothetical protein
MHENLETVIRKLHGRDLRAVVSALPEVTKDRLKKVYATDPSAWAELQRIDEAQAALIVKGLVPALIAGQQLTDEALRELLLGLAEHDEYEPYLRAALERRLLVSIDPVTMGSLLVLILSVKWKFKIKKTKDGKIEFEFEASKNATPQDFLKKLLARIPGLGGGSSDISV